MRILNRGTNSTKINSNKNILAEKENTLGKSNQKKYKKVVYEEESDSEPEEEESQHIPEEQEEIKEPKVENKQPAQKRKNNILEYLNNDGKRNKR